MKRIMYIIIIGAGLWMFFAGLMSANTIASELTGDIVKGLEDFAPEADIKIISIQMALVGVRMDGAIIDIAREYASALAGLGIMAVGYLSMLSDNMNKKFGSIALALARIEKSVEGNQQE